MKIGVDIRCLMANNYSGVAEYTYSLLNNLFEIDSENQYTLFYNSSKDISQNLPTFDQPNVKLAGFKYPNKILNFSLKYFHYPKIDQMIKNVDLFFIPNFIFIALSKKCKKILTVHDLSFTKYPHFFSLKRKLWHKFINPEKTITQADKLIADSINTKNDLIDQYGLPKDKIKVIHLGVDTELYKKLSKDTPNLTKVRTKYNLPKEFILYLGTIEPRKNIEGIIESFNLFKTKHQKNNNTQLIIAGEKGWKYKKIFELAEKSQFKEQIKFIGYVNREDKPYLYNLAQAFIFPSFYEGFGLPVLEAQACGTPVIAGLNSSFPEVMKDSALLVNPDNLTEIKQAICRILNNQELKEKLIKKGFKNIKRFSWEKTAQKTLNYLTS